VKEATREGSSDGEQAVESDQEQQRIEQGTNQGGGSIPPWREVQNQSATSEEAKETDDSHVVVSDDASTPQRTPNLQKTPLHAKPIYR